MKDLRAIGLVLGLTWRSSRRLTVQMVALSLLSTVSSALLAVALKFLVDAAVLQEGRTAAVGAALAAVGLASAVASMPLGGMVSLVLTERSSAAYDQHLVELVSRIPTLEGSSSSRYSSTLHLLTEEDRFPSTSAVPAVVALAGTALMVLLTTAYLGSQRPLLALVPVAVVPLVWAGGRANKIWSRAREATAPSQHLAGELLRLATTPEAAKELRVFGSADQVLERHAAAERAVRTGLRRAIVISSALHVAIWTGFGLLYGVTVLAMARRAASGAATAGDVVLVIVLTLAVVVLTQGASWPLFTLGRVAAAGERLRWLAQQGRVPASAPSRPVPERLSVGIRLNGVEFTYPDAARPALSGVDVLLPAGSVVALVGDNGAGKSTLVSLLCGLRQPTAGAVLVDDVDLREIDPQTWRDRISATFQDFVRYELLTREAVGLGDLSRLDDQQALDSAAMRGGAADVLPNLPDGWDTQLGTRWANGRDLSGGQWQKLAVSRGLMREAPLLVVLDEPAAAMDPVAEHRLFEQFSNAAARARSAGAVTVVVSHRFSTARLADLVLVVDAGHLVEVGNHASLMAAQGLYSQLYSLQATSYA